MRLPILHIFVEHQDSDRIKALENETAELKEKLKALEKDRDDAARRAIYEMQVNNELLDLLRANGIYHRPSADLKKFLI